MIKLVYEPFRGGEKVVEYRNATDALCDFLLLTGNCTIRATKKHDGVILQYENETGDYAALEITR